MVMSTGGQPGKGIFLSVVSSEFEAYEVGKYLMNFPSIGLSHHVYLCTKDNRNQIECTHLNI